MASICRPRPCAAWATVPRLLMIAAYVRWQVSTAHTFQHDEGNRRCQDTNVARCKCGGLAVKLHRGDKRCAAAGRERHTKHGGHAPDNKSLPRDVNCLSSLARADQTSDNGQRADA